MVGIILELSGNVVLSVKFLGPILREMVLTQIQRHHGKDSTHPNIPSKGEKPVEFEATPMDCREITAPGAIVTSSMYSVPEIGCEYI